ncbi:MAG: EAL domain-containing protein [Burkholderiales bacterium]|nr:EAL domain-containing protein [Burkholderiales bacterium]
MQILTRVFQGVPTLGWRILLPLVLACFTATVFAQTREVRVGVYQNEPKIFMGADGQPSGILGELLVEIARLEGWRLRPVRCEWQACLDALQAGNLDLMPDVAYSEQRDIPFDFHKVPALLSWSQIYKHPGVNINSALDLRGKRIAVLEGSVQQSYLTSMLAGFGVRAELVPVKSFKEGFELVASGALQAAATNQFFGDSQAPRYRLESTPILFLPSQLFYATASGRNADLLQAIDRRLEEWDTQPNSRYFVILKHWVDTPPQFGVPRYVWWTLAALALALLISVVVAELLRRQVARKTAHIKASEDRLATILNGVDAYIYIKDPELRYQYANRKVCELFGVPMAEVVGKTDAAFFDAASVTKIMANDLRVMQHGERVEEEEVNSSLDGTQKNTYLSIKLPLRNADGSIYALCGISTDISRHKQAEQAIHQLAFYDPLTQLPNRRLLLERMQAALLAHRRDQQCGALLFIDVDNFKDLNDTLGHQLGDELLRQIAQRLTACIRAQDTLARQGGDEFVVMLQGLSASMDEAVQQAHQVADKVLQRLHAPYLLDRQQFNSSVSIGVAMFAPHTSNQDDLLKQADLAMYQAKAEGRNTVRFFDPQMQAVVQERTTIEADMRKGIATGEFLLHYQPQVDGQGRVIAVEALARWKHPTRGLVPPIEFIGVAESSGLILPLGDWVLDTACRQLVTWAALPEMAHRTIAVNVSARQFRQPHFVESVQSALTTTGAPPNRLELELTESLLVDDVPSVVAKMNALKAVGVRLSLDDFGTGYSSLSMLKRLPLDQLKIDQTFVRDLLTDPQDASIVRAIVAMGQSLNLQVIAEGVETQAQYDALLALGCSHFQGYLFGRPAAV